MNQSEFSIEPFRFLVDVSQEVLKGDFMLVLFIVFISINQDGRLSVRRSYRSVGPSFLMDLRFSSVVGICLRYIDDRIYQTPAKGRRGGKRRCLILCHALR